MNCLILVNYVVYYKLIIIVRSHTYSGGQKVIGIRFLILFIKYFLKFFNKLSEIKIFN